MVHKLFSIIVLCDVCYIHWTCTVLCVKKTTVIVTSILAFSAFTVLTRLVGCREEHLACNNWVLVCLSVWSEMQIVCIWSTWCYYYPKTPSSVTSFKSRLVLPVWYRLTQVVLEKRQLNGCIITSICHCETVSQYASCVKVTSLW